MSKFAKFILGILLFDLLFYQHPPGVNVGLFAVGIWLIISYRRRPLFRDPAFLLLSAALLTSAASFAWYGDALSFFALFLSFFMVGVQAQYPRIRFLLYPPVAAVNVLSFPIRIFYSRYWLPMSTTKNLFPKVFATILFPALIALLFFGVYSTGSDAFQSAYRALLFGFDLPQLIVLSVLGFFLLFHLWFLYLPRPLIRLNLALRSNDQTLAGPRFFPLFKLMDPHLEARSGRTTLTLLNILLLLFIAAYSHEQFFTPQSPQSLSGETHERVATVIVSILMAIAVILYFFRQAGLPAFLRRSAYLWLLLNVLLVAAAMLKNSLYILEFGLTFKRIGVCIFLMLCVIGLCLCAYKIARQKTNAFLVDRCLWVCYVCGVLCAPVNFSRLVTEYNLHHHKNDLLYLQSLPFNKVRILREMRTRDASPEEIQNQMNHLKLWADEPFLSSALYYGLPRVQETAAMTDRVYSLFDPPSKAFSGPA